MYWNIFKVLNEIVVWVVARHTGVADDYSRPTIHEQQVLPNFMKQFFFSKFNQFFTVEFHEETLLCLPVFSKAEIHPKVIVI